MQHRFRILFLSLLSALCLGLAACSDSDDDLNGGMAKGYEVNDYYTDLLRQAWKITEHEYADKSYYTKDFQTSWVINSPFRYDGKEYCPFNYKLSLQSEINYVEEVEVGTFPDGEDWIVDLATGRLLFAIEDLHYGGNRYIMILRDSAGNRFRCETVSVPCIYFVENMTDRTLEAQYVRLFSPEHSREVELDYTVKSLKPNVIGAYAVLIEDKYNYPAVDVKFTASNGNSKLLTSSGLQDGWNRGVISGDFSTSEEPDEPVTPEYDTEMEEAILGTWLSDNNSTNFFNYYNLEGTYVFDYRIESYSRFISTFDATRIRVKNEADGSKWAVDESGNTRFFEIRNFKARASMEIRLDGQSEWTHLYCYSDNARVFFIENGSSYEMLEVTYNYVTGGIAETIYPDCFYAAMQDYHYQGMLGINGWIFPETYTVKASVKAYRSSASSTPDAEFEYTAEVPAGSNITRAIITDADIPYKPNAEDVAKLEAHLWQSNKATAWRIDQYATKEGDTFSPLSTTLGYGWLITERNIGLEQGLHIGGLSNLADGNYYLKIVDDKLFFTSWDGKGKMVEILTPVNQILKTGVMDIRFKDNQRVYRCTKSKKPLILYADRQSNITGPRYVKLYKITEKNSYDRPVSTRSISNSYFEYTITNATPVSAWCLAADEVLNPDEGVFSAELYLNGETTPATTSNNLRLGIAYSITIYK